MTNLKSQYRRLFEGRTSSNDSSLLRENSDKDTFLQSDFGKKLTQRYAADNKYPTGAAKELGALVSAMYQIPEETNDRLGFEEIPEFEILNDFTDELDDAVYKGDDPEFQGQTLDDIRDEFGDMFDMIEEAPEELIKQYLPAAYAAVSGHI